MVRILKKFAIGNGTLQRINNPLRYAANFVKKTTPLQEFCSCKGVFLWNKKMLLCNIMPPRIALAILAKQSAGFAFLFDRKLLLCSVTSPRIALAILVEQNAGFAL